MFDEARLERLISAYLDQELTADEKRELEEMLLASSRAREIFLDRANWHGLLREHALQGQAALLMDEEAPAPSSSAPPDPAPKKIIPFRRKAAWLVAALAACVALGWWLLPRPAAEKRGIVKRGKGTEHVALLAQAIGVTWEDGSSSFGTGSALPRGWVKISSGTLRLDFYSGARVILEGPASLELLSPDLARLEKGKLTARVPPPAEGFTVISSDLRVVDRGTEFGMNVSGTNDCEVHVFDGEVELQGELPATAEKALYQGNAVSIREGRWTSMPADRGSFADPAAVLTAAVRESEAQLAAWQKDSLDYRSLPDLKVYFDFEGLHPGDQVIPNLAAGADESSNGTVIGCDPLPGRWPRKGALGFAKTSDRVRFRADGTTPSLTLLARVRVDSLPQSHNHLLSMAPESVGEVHWKIDQSGCLVLGVRAEAKLASDSWERLTSPRIVTEQDFGRWMQLATVIDGSTGTMKHFVNGKEIASGKMARRPAIQLGLANLGNFDASAPEFQTNIVRSFNGRIDEFAIFTRALDASEIAAIK
ncbi:LamG-like jellyroll fold domain-containing protein [Luteolibacter luteus]|uniref:LamG-like jellyroll fold domain-containing protein n=1 Tax=Luteolibacter luteus TaxID=2728835 RepID=A0A858RDS9_9BACT|nr:LamG-like jellyroll fold domain-containing protein [Luteolibacter luteus]QJE94333.1 hypothetical protein HHL09_00545 [Luteolibacter luteus]